MIPLGQREDHRLELKGADALNDPEKIAREVVAMLNADGGDIWIGLREEGGRAVAVEPIANPQKEMRQLWDFLVDTIEPSPSHGEIRLEPIDEGEGVVLQLSVASTPGRQPYAFLRKGGRHFVIRIGDRIRPMTRDEVFTRPPALDRKVEDAEAKVLRDRKKLLEQGNQVFWLRLQPSASVSLDLQDPDLEEILQTPELSGNRRNGWNFSKSTFRPQLLGDSLKTAPQEYRSVEIRRDGGLMFAAPLEAFWRREEGEIWPPILIESTVSALRMARAIYQGKISRKALVVVDLVLVGIQGWKLRPGTPGPWFQSNEAEIFRHANDFSLAQPLAFRFEEIEENPDRCGYRLIERVYEAFGLRRDGIPKIFDESGRLVMGA